MNTKILLSLIITTILLPKQKHASCTKGCLKCDPTTQECLICDSPNQFVLDTHGICHQVELQNCRFIRPDGVCAKCEQGFYFNVNYSKCRQVEESNLNENCVEYSHFQECIMCRSGFVLIDGWCEQVQVLVDFCEVYENNGICRKCQKTYLLSTDRRSCVKQVDEKHCLSYTRLECQQCQKNFVLSRDFYSNYFSKESPDLKQHLYEYLSLRQTFSNFVGKKYCRLAEVSHCVDYISTKECRQCEPGYILTVNNICILERISKIANCKIYQDLQVCSECSSGYFLDNSTCVQVAPIADCLHYSGVDGGCVECVSGFFLQTGGCQPRVTSLDIKNCSQLALNLDSCLTCVDGYKLTQNDSLCVNNIENCLDYQVTSVNADGNHDYTCVKCLDKHYVNASGNGGLGECLQGTIENCQEYAVDKDECVKCGYGFFLSGSNTCDPSDPKNLSPNCLETDSTQPDTCLQCKPNFVLIQRRQECELADRFKDILNSEESKCIQWADDTRCTDCEPMFYGTTCQNETGPFDACYIFYDPINTTSVDDACKECHYDYYLGADQKCYLRPHLAIEHCIEFDKASNECLDCEEGFVLDSDLSSYCAWNRQKSTGDPTVESSVRYWNTIPNCSVYKGENTECARCELTYFLSEDRLSCLAVCDTSTHTHVLQDHEISGDALKTTIKSVRFCLAKVPNCHTGTFLPYVLPSGHFNTSFVCLKCDSGKFKVVKQHKHLQYIPFDVENNDPFFHRNIQSPFFTCGDVSTVVDKCEFYMDHDNKVSTGSWSSDPNNAISTFCVRCQRGYQGDFVETSNTGTDGHKIFHLYNRGYTSCDVPIINCEYFRSPFGLEYRPMSRRQVYSTLRMPWTSYFSCPFCKDDFISIIYVGSQSDTSTPDHMDQFYFDIISFNKDPTADLKTGATSKSLSKCLPRFNSAFSLNDQFSGKPLVIELDANCKAAIRFTDRAETPTPIGNEEHVLTLVKCVACKPGYRPTEFDPINPRFITKCEQIQHCDSMNGLEWYNSCSGCADDYLWKWDNSAMEVDYTECVSNTHMDFDCVAMLDATTCGLCKAGFEVDSNGICQQIDQDNCETLRVSDSEEYIAVKARWFQQNGSFGGNPIDYFQYFGLFKEGFGCFDCNDLFSLIRTKEKRCISKADDPKAMKNPANESIPHCLTYFYDYSTPVIMHTLKCSKCAAGTIPFSSNTLCDTEIPNCKIGNSPVFRTCHTCEDLFALSSDSKTCSSYKVEDCKTYSSSSSKSCVDCNQGYIIDSVSNSCVEIPVFMCIKYDSSSKQCLECADEYVLFDYTFQDSETSSTETVPICVLASEHLNCESSLLKLQGGFLECGYFCNNRSFLQTNASSVAKKQLCAELPPTLLNCQSQKKSGDHFECTQCADSFYLNTQYKECYPQIQVDNCLHYYADKIGCRACRENFILFSYSICEPIELQIQNCDLYVNQNTCSKCFAHFYLNNNECVPVDLSSVIPNCRYYSGPTECERCENNYILVANACQEIKAVNCLEYDDQNSCKTCPLKHGLKTDTSTGFKNCEVLDITNCLISSTEHPFNCETCSNGYYVQSNACVMAARNIPNCKYLDSETTCKECNPNYFLTDDRTSCWHISIESQNLDTNCELFDNTALSCSFCREGYYMDSNGDCLPCTYNLESGCLMCDYADPSKCVICVSGYFMDKDEKCAVYSDVVDTAVEGTGEARLGWGLLCLLLLLFGQLE